MSEKDRQAFYRRVEWARRIALGLLVALIVEVVRLALTHQLKSLSDEKGVAFASAIFMLYVLVGAMNAMLRSQRPKTVTLDASIDGSPGIVRDETTLL